MISIFAKQAFLNTNPYSPFEYKGTPPKYGQLMRVSSMIRGNQIANQIGAKLNPESGYENGICIYVKPHVIAGQPYLDIIDGHNLGQLALKHPKVTVIVCSQADMETMTGVISNRIVLIPQHHCNFERVKRTRTEIKTVGVIGTRGAFPLLPKGLKEELAKRNIELLEFSKFFTRQNVIDFYLKIDIQIVWRPYKKLLSNPLKLVNAASFGVPTIALDEPAFKEMGGCYIGVKRLEELLIGVDWLIDNPEEYKELSRDCLEKAEEYHIENVGKLYKELEK